MADTEKQKYTSAELSKWLIEKAENTRNPVTARRILVSNDQRGRSTVLMGRMFFYRYSPKDGDRMTKYDRFPMCIPIKRLGNGFLGLNLHYLDVGSRERLIELLLVYRSEALISDKTRMMVDYDLIMADRRMANLAEPCVHRYLWSQCRSRFIEIYPSEFDKAIQLPVENWVFNQ